MMLNAKIDEFFGNTCYTYRRILELLREKCDFLEAIVMSPKKLPCSID